MEDPSNGFFTNRWLAHNQFVGLGNLLKIVVHHLLIGVMTSLGYRNEFPIVSVLVCMVTHWIEPMVSRDLRLSRSHNLTKLFHYIISQPWENIEFVLKLQVVLTYEWDCNLIIHSLWIGSLLMEDDSNRYSQQIYYDISWD